MSGYKSLFESALAAEGVTGKLADVARSVNFQESGRGTNTTTSNRGAVGGMQILPGTFAEVADKGWDINDPMHNARAGIRYLKKMDQKAGGDPALTAAGYYGGPGGLEKARKGIAVYDPDNPKAPSTLDYGKQVASRLGSGGGVVPAPDRPVARPMDAMNSVMAQGQAPVQEAPMQVAEPIAVAAPEQGAAPMSPEQNAWLAFIKQMAPVAGPQASPLAMASYGQLNVPDFSQVAQVKPSNAINFNAWKPRV